MVEKIDTYDILGIFVPGTLLIGWGNYCFPQVGLSAMQTPYPEAFSVIVLTALVIFSGQVIQALASLLEPAIHYTWGGRPSDSALKGTLKRYLPVETSDRIKKKLQVATGPDASEHSLFLYAIQHSDGRDSGRASRFNSLYAYHRALLILSIMALLIFLASTIWGSAALWSCGHKVGVGIIFLFLTLLIWYRAWQRGCYYAREVLLTAERHIDAN